MRLLGKALTFDDVLLVPAFSQVLPKDTSLATPFSRRILLNLPLVSAAMDTVTEARLAIAIAQEGGMGIVFEARQRSIDREVAMKMMKGKGAKDKEQRSKFLTEAVVTGELDHPNIVPIYDLGAQTNYIPNRCKY